MNLSAIPLKSAVGRLARLPLRLIPPQTHVPILQGRLRGKQWIVGSSNHGCWLGSYEYDKRKLFEDTVRPGGVVYDIGANAGYYTLLSSCLVGPTGRVIAFEPLPRNIHYVKEHVRLNHLTNVTLIDAAVAEVSGTAHFDLDRNHSMGKLSNLGSLEVRTVVLDDLVSTGVIPPPDCMKIDVEGGEASVLTGASRLLTEHHPSILLATHGPEVHRLCCEMLVAHGYDLTPIGAASLSVADEILAR